MKTRTARALVVAATAVAMTLLVACGGDNDASEESPTAWTASPQAVTKTPVTPTAAAPTEVATSPTESAPTSPPPPPVNTPAQPPPPQNSPIPPPPPAPTNTPVPPPPPSGVTVFIKALTTAFSPNSATVPAGATVTLTFDNQDEGVMHDFVLYGSGGSVIASTEIATAPSTQTVTFTLSPGQYAFKCSVHPREMTGAITAQ